MMSPLARGRTSFGISVPQRFWDEPVSPKTVANQLVRAEQLGYESAWVHDALLGSVPGLEPFTLLAYAGAVTSRMRLGLAVLVLPRTSPLHVAKMSASLDQLTGGRMILGLGIGRQPELYPAFGYTPERRVRRFEEGIEIIKKAWAEDSITYQGRFFSMQNLKMQPKPVQEPLPLIFGGHAPTAMRRAVRFGNGWMGAGSASISKFAESLGQLREMLEEAGIERRDFHISKRVYIAVDDDRDAALTRLQGWFGAVYGDFIRAEGVCIWGNDEECAEQIEGLIEEDLDLVVLNPLFDFQTQTERLAESVLPKLGGREQR